MTEEIAEIIGIFLVICGAVAVVMAAALVSPALAYLVAGLLSMLAGALVVTVANRSAAAKAAPKSGG